MFLKYSLNCGNSRCGVDVMVMTGDLGHIHSTYELRKTWKTGSSIKIKISVGTQNIRGSSGMVHSSRLRSYTNASSPACSICDTQRNPQIPRPASSFTSTQLSAEAHSLGTEVCSLLYLSQRAAAGAVTMGFAEQRRITEVRVMPSRGWAVQAPAWDHMWIVIEVLPDALSTFALAVQSWLHYLTSYKSWHEWTEHRRGAGSPLPRSPMVFGPFMPGTCICTSTPPPALAQSMAFRARFGGLGVL